EICAAHAMASGSATAAAAPPPGLAGAAEDDIMDTATDETGAMQGMVALHGGATVDSSGALTMAELDDIQIDEDEIARTQAAAAAAGPATPSPGLPLQPATVAGDAARALDGVFQDYVEEEMLRYFELVQAHSLILPSEIRNQMVTTPPTWTDIDYIITKLAYNHQASDPWAVLGFGPLDGPKPPEQDVCLRTKTAITLCSFGQSDRWEQEGKDRAAAASATFLQAGASCEEMLADVLRERHRVRLSPLPRWKELGKSAVQAVWGLPGCADAMLATQWSQLLGDAGTDHTHTIATHRGLAALLEKGEKHASLVKHVDLVLQPVEYVLLGRSAPRHVRQGLACITIAFGLVRSAATVHTPLTPLFSLPVVNSLWVDLPTDMILDLLHKPHVSEARDYSISIISRGTTRSPGNTPESPSKVELLLHGTLSDATVTLAMRFLRRSVLSQAMRIGHRDLYTFPDALILECNGPMALRRAWPLCSQALFLSTDRWLIFSSASVESWTTVLNQSLLEDVEHAITKIKWKASRFGGQQWVSPSATPPALAASRRRRGRAVRASNSMDHVVEVFTSGETRDAGGMVLDKLMTHVSSAAGLTLEPRPPGQHPSSRDVSAPPGRARLYLRSADGVRKVYAALHGQVLQVGTDHVSITAQNDLLDSRTLSGEGQGRTACAGSPFLGEISAVTWNCQAPFASDPSRYRRRAQHARQFMTTHDVGLWTETHGTQGSGDTWRKPSGCTSWRSPGAVAGSAGSGITVKNTLMEQFTAPHRWWIFHHGRAAVLQLRGPLGNLDLLVTHFHTGTVYQHDIDAAGLSDLGRTLSCTELREALRRRFTHSISPKDEVLTILGGDSNYVSE
ncbi:unnamed protein product, partial [Prorocentrum cordatum]